MYTSLLIQHRALANKKRKQTQSCFRKSQITHVISDAMHLIIWQIGGHFRGRNGSSRKSCLCCSETFPRKPREALQGDEDQDCSFQEGEYAEDFLIVIVQSENSRFNVIRPGTPCSLASNMTEMKLLFVLICTVITNSVTFDTYQPLVGLITPLVEHCNGMADVMESNPVQSWLFFSCFCSQLLKLRTRLRWSFTY